MSDRKQILTKARMIWEEQGEIEIKDDAVISEANAGYWVEAKVWVPIKFYQIVLVHPSTDEILKVFEFDIPHSYCEIFGSLVQDLDGKLATQTKQNLEEFINKFPNTKLYFRDYLAPTPGNAVDVIQKLLTFIGAYPNGRWRVTF